MRNQVLTAFVAADSAAKITRGVAHRLITEANPEMIRRNLHTLAAQTEKYAALSAMLDPAHADNAAAVAVLAALSETEGAIAAMGAAAVAGQALASAGWAALNGHGSVTVSLVDGVHVATVPPIEAGDLSAMRAAATALRDACDAVLAA